MINYLILFGIAVLPVIVLMIYIYRQDKYQKEPIKTLAKAFIGGMMAIPLDILIVTGIDGVLGDTFIANTVFFTAFLEAGIPEEFSKFLIFMIFIWRDKNFDEYFDGIVYASFIGLGFACVENIGYVFEYGFQTGVVRALLSVPGHFLFGVVMGYFLSLAKFHPEKRSRLLLSGLLLSMLAHGLFDWLLMVASVLPIVAPGGPAEPPVPGPGGGRLCGPLPWAHEAGGVRGLGKFSIFIVLFLFCKDKKYQKEKLKKIC